MRRAARLQFLEKVAVRKFGRFGRHVERLRRKRIDPTKPFDVHEVEVELGAVLINLQAFWGNWCRSYYLSTALGSHSRAYGRIASALAITTEHNALTVAIKGVLVPKKPPPASWQSKQEPHWYDPIVLAEIIGNAAIGPNLPLEGLLKSAPIGISDLRIFRNYYAHRSFPLRQAALNVGPRYLVGSPVRPSDILLFVEPSRSVSVLEGWTIDFTRLSRALCA